MKKELVSVGIHMKIYQIYAFQNNFGKKVGLVFKNFHSCLSSDMVLLEESDPWSFINVELVPLKGQPVVTSELQDALEPDNLKTKYLHNLK